MASSPKPTRTRPALPRLVDQLRLLSWFQFYLTLAYVLGLFIRLAILESDRHQVGYLSPLYEGIQDLSDQTLVAILGALGAAILMAIGAAFARRGWLLVYPIVLAAQASLVAVLVLAVVDRIYLGLAGVILVVLGGWIVADLFRGEVWAFVRRKKRAPVPVG